MYFHEVHGYLALVQYASILKGPFRFKSISRLTPISNFVAKKRTNFKSRRLFPLSLAHKGEGDD